MYHGANKTALIIKQSTRSIPENNKIVVIKNTNSLIRE